LNKQKRVMRADELYKFLDGMLMTVHDKLQNVSKENHMELGKIVTNGKPSSVNIKQHYGRTGVGISLVRLQLRKPDGIVYGVFEFQQQFSAWTKHVAVRYHFIKEQVENEIVELYFVKTAYQLADIFTKALARERFEFLVKRQDMQSITPEELKHLAESNEDEQ
nr:ribonuclease H [Tanacetum cinerariifolium]